jgi:hypothetical protein
MIGDKTSKSSATIRKLPNGKQRKKVVHQKTNNKATENMKT